MLRSQERTSPQPKPLSRAASSDGQGTFVSTCAGCHGLDGRGSERAPNIASSARMQRLSDTEIQRIISDGVPGTGMPAFHSLGQAGIKSVVRYLRTLQGRNEAVTLPGDPAKGKSAFFGDAGCSTCHMSEGAGGFLGPDLTAYAGTRSVTEIRDAITSKNTGPRKQSVVAITRDGQRYSGAVRNEDNFSVQLQTPDGAFHFFMKEDLQSLEHQSQPLMPLDYGSRLSRQELDDLVSYLLSIRGNTKPAPSAREDD